MTKLTSIALALLALLAALASNTAAAQSAPPAIAPRPVLPSPTPPGLYVAVIDGLVKVTNPSGTSNFAAGQFGFTPSTNQAPAPIPKNPGLPFTLPVAFSTPTQPSGSNAPKAKAVDCEVR